MYEWKAFTEEELKIICSNPYVKSVTQKMIRFTKEFKEECWRRFNEEHQTVRKIMTDMGFDPEILGQKRMDGIIIHLREQSRSGEGFRDVRRSPESRVPSDRPLPPSRAILKMQHQLAYLAQEVEFIKKLGGQCCEAEKMIKSQPEVKFSIIREMTCRDSNLRRIKRMMHSCIQSSILICLKK
jgi:hypothetical protein